MSALSFLVRLVFISAFLCCVQAMNLDITMVQEDEGDVTFTATPDNIIDATMPWFLNLELVNGTATGPDDFVLVGGGPLSDTSPTFVIRIVNNSIYEGDKEFVVSFTGGFNVAASYPVDVTITIKEDEDRPVEFMQPANMTVSENIGKVNITIERLPATTRAFGLNVFTMGTAEEGVDYNLTTALPLSFAANETEAVLSIYIYDDLDAEPTESICFYFNTTDSDDVIMKYLYITDDDTPMSFNCLRPSQDCKNNGTCNFADFTCDCPAGFQVAANCGIDDGDLPSDCDPICVNGTCVAGECICDPGFGGEACDRTAYYHLCTATSFGICLSPFGVDDFSGDMFVAGTRGDPDCVLRRASEVSDDAIPDPCDGYAAVIPFNGSCGDFIVPGVDPAQYKVVINVHYTANVTKASDEAVCLTCSRGEATVQSGSTAIEGGSSDPAYPQIEESEYAPAELTLTDTGGEDLPDPVQPGTVIKVCVSVLNVPESESIIIDTATISNGREGNDSRSAVLYYFGCFPTDGGIASGPAYEPDGETHTVCFYYEIFFFPHDKDLPEPQIILSVEFTVGEGGVTPTPHKCDRRRKRQAGNSKEGTLEHTINILNPDYQQAEQLTGSEDSTCARWLYPAFIGVGVVALAMMVIIIVLAVAVKKRFNVKTVPEEFYK